MTADDSLMKVSQILALLAQGCHIAWDDVVFRYQDGLEMQPARAYPSGTWTRWNGNERIFQWATWAESFDYEVVCTPASQKSQSHIRRVEL